MSLSPRDHLAIQQLCARYYVTTDTKDVDGFMDCWVDDDDIHFESAFGDFSGRDGIRAFEEEHVHGGMAEGKRHLLGNVVITPGEDDDTARVSSYLVVLEVEQLPTIVATAHYPSCLVERTDSGWKFRHRKMNVDPGFEAFMAQLQQ